MENINKEKTMALLGEVEELSRALNEKIDQLKESINFEGFEKYGSEPEIYAYEGDVVLYWFNPNYGINEHTDYGLNEMKRLLEKKSGTVKPIDFVAID